MDVILPILTFLAGWGTRHYYSHVAYSDRKQNHRKVMQELEELKSFMLKTASEIEEDRPDVSEKIKESVQTGEYPEAIIDIVRDGDTCPTCSVGEVEFVEFGRGPLGPTNAWYRCQNCGHAFQTPESPQD
jgi:rubredoxin